MYTEQRSCWVKTVRPGYSTMADLISELLGLSVPLFLIALGFFNGRRVEKKHLRQLDQREARLRHIVQSNLKHVPPGWRCTRAELVAAEAVIASDYFKTIAAGLRNFFGGEVRSLETLMVRARREAKLRIVEMAASAGASAVWNIRLETSTVGRTSARRQGAMAEIYAYGTALWFEPQQ